MKPQGEFHEFNSRYISAGIGDDYKKWKKRTSRKSSTNVFIESPTGTGKTYFLIDKILPYAIEKDRSIIYLCNRDVLKKQIENAIIEKRPDLTVSHNTHKSISVFLYPNSYATIAVVNYQSFATLDKMDFYNLYYVVLDEVHFFLEDATFNVFTHDIYLHLLSKYMNQVHIFLSATMWEFYEIYIDTCMQFLPEHPQQQVFDALYTLNYEYYRNCYSKPLYNIILYKTDKFLINRIQDSNDKWLFFVSSIKDGEIMKKCIEIVTSKKCFFLTKNKKYSRAWKSLVENSCFKEDILITTKVLDNGVSIHDNMVRNIVLPAVNQTELMQMLGRKRVSDDSIGSTNIYIKQPSMQVVNAMLKSHREKIAFFKKIGALQTNTYKQRLIREYWRSEKYNMLFHFNFAGNEVNLKYNILSIYKFANEIAFYEYLHNAHANTQAYMNCLHAWLRNNIISIQHENIHSNTNNLIEFLNCNINSNISDTDSFYESFMELYKMFCYKKFMEKEPEDLKEFQNALAIRKGSTQRKATINRCLELLQLPYKLEKKSKCWVLYKLSQ